ncbi:MAG TPA: methionyl-tRNA formyltransferase [Candidatus Parcubacteria bacterium]|nr:methionyl-tRNA formyltransferase [Candidatus Parcubacteria bacterium]
MEEKEKKEKAKKIKTIFFGTPKFGALVLEELLRARQKPSLIITAPDKPAGRKKIVTPPEVKILAQKNKIPVIQPEKIKEIDREILKKINLDLGIIAAYSQIIPKDIINIPEKGFLNVHPSLLPKYRGPSPIQSAIINNEQKTGVTIILLDEKLDHGPIIAQEELKINQKKYSYDELEEKLAKIGGKLLVKIIPQWIKGRVEPKPQDDSKATYTKKIEKEDGEIDWSRPAEEIERKIRAFQRWPGAFTFFKKNDKISKLKIIKAEVVDKNISDKICVKCGQNYLLIKKLQPEGKKPMGYKDFQNGYGQIIILRTKKRDANNS